MTSQTDPAALRALREKLEALRQHVAPMLNPNDPASFMRAVEIHGLLGEAAAVLAALLDEREKLAGGWRDEANECDRFAVIEWDAVRQARLLREAEMLRRCADEVGR